MADDSFTADESRRFAVVVARAWADPQMAESYRRDPQAVLAGAGIKLGDRTAPDLPDKPSELESQPVEGLAMSSSASSLSCATCPCSGCTASCACCTGLKAEPTLEPSLDAMMKLAEDPEGRKRARELMSRWDVRVGGAA